MRIFYSQKTEEIIKKFELSSWRHKIEENPKQPHFIKTIRGKGYKLICNEL